MEELSKSLKFLIQSWEKSSEPWGAKDNQSRFIYANNKYNKLLSLPDKFNVEGRFDGELPASTSDFQSEFQEHDRKVELLQDRVTSVEIHAFEGNSYFQPWFFDKYPIKTSINYSRYHSTCPICGAPITVVKPATDEWPD